MTDLRISTDPADIDLDVVHGFLSRDAYWCPGIPRDVVARALANSLCFSALVDGRHFVDGVLEAHAPILRWGLRTLTLPSDGVSAITFGHVVLGIDADALSRTRAHERVHVRPYERWGPTFIPAYLLASPRARTGR